MPYYNCTFLDDNGHYIKKTIFADSKEYVWDNYSNGEDKLISVKRNFFKGEVSLKIFQKKIAYFDFHLFNQKMITLLKSGVSFVRGLEIIISNIKRGTLKEVLMKTESDIKNGIQISDAFSSTLIPFGKIYRASLLAGEKSGNIETILSQFNSYLYKIANLRRKVISSMSYPVILLVFMVGMVVLILTLAIPKFAVFYGNFGQKLPPITRFLVNIGNFFKNNTVFMALGIAAVIGTVKFIEKTKPDVIIVDYLLTRIPFIGEIIVENAMTVFARTMAILIGGGIPVPDAVQIAVDTFSNRYFYKQIQDIPIKIKEGNLLSDTLKEVSFIPSVLVEVIKVGETSGNLKDVLNENADAFENSIDAKINSLITMIEPVLIIFIGTVIAFMLLAVYLPIFNMVKVVQ